MHPYEWGILGVKAIALLLAIGRTIPSRLLDISRLLRLLRRIAGARKLLASVANAELDQLACVVPDDAPS
jgi:hypothetical protein